jgi:hypothetical protein
MGQKENATAYAVIQILNLYHVQYTREQSRVLNIGASSDARGYRPMYIGDWVDAEGKRHSGGKADFLARPRIQLQPVPGVTMRLPTMSVPLWIETKAAGGKMSPNQHAFKRWVEKNGDTYLLIVEDARPLLTWLDDHGVERGGAPEDVELIVKPLDASALNGLPCKWCGMIRDQHQGKILSCPVHLVGCDPKLIGKVWSPDLRKGARTRGENLIGGNVGVDPQRN